MSPPPSTGTEMELDIGLCCFNSSTGGGRDGEDAAAAEEKHKSTCKALAEAGKKAAANNAGVGVSLEEHMRVWVEKKVSDGVPMEGCSFPFLTNEPRLVQCRMCLNYVYPGQEVACSVRDCLEIYHRQCAKETPSCWSSRVFKCPQHACYVCKKSPKLRCIRCTKAVHINCAPWPNKIIFLKNRWAVCWKHPTDWRWENQHADPTKNVEEVFRRLPLPYVEQDFKIGSILKDATEDVAEPWKSSTENVAEPAPYTQIKRNIYLVKKRRDEKDSSGRCSNCSASSTCRSECECRGLNISCSKACHCSDNCQNRPFRKEKKIKVVKTKHCGWGVVALESMKKGDFVIEYIGEVIDDSTCEKRLWALKDRGDHNFYMCEISKDFTIDATFKGNASRFLNHSCAPNCKLEKWQVDGEIRVGVFTSRSIDVGEPLTYDYRFVHFGPLVKCFCGSANCQGFLGSKKIVAAPVLPWQNPRKTDLPPLPYCKSKRKMNQKPFLSWGVKRKRTVALHSQRIKRTRAGVASIVQSLLD